MGNITAPVANQSREPEDLTHAEKGQKTITPELSEVLSDICPTDANIANIIVYPKTARIVVLGDIHGDIEYLQRLLYTAKVINREGKWIGKTTVVVQTGDQVDRCRNTKQCHVKGVIPVDEDDDDMEVMDYLDGLQRQAIVYGGKVISLFGNHEINQILGKMNMVSWKSLKRFGYDLKKRRVAFKPGGPEAIRMACTRLSFVVIGNFFFGHSGLRKGTLEKLDIRNRDDLVGFDTKLRMWMAGKQKLDDQEATLDAAFYDRKPGQHKVGAAFCANEIEPCLNVLNVNGIVVGHTVTENGTIESSCGRKVWKVDLGGSKSFAQFFDQNQPVPAVMEILNDRTINVLTEAPSVSAMFVTNKNKNKNKNREKKNQNQS